MDQDDLDLLDKSIEDAFDRLRVISGKTYRGFGSSSSPRMARNSSE
jgi:hypothetical protein